MTKTVDDLRNEIRATTGRFEREISATFTMAASGIGSTVRPVGNLSNPGGFVQLERDLVHALISRFVCEFVFETLCVPNSGGTFSHWRC